MEEQKQIPQKIKVGQTVWLVGGHYGRNTNEARERKVEKVGKKYFYVKEGYRDVQISLSDLKEVSDSNYKSTAYLSIEEYEAKRMLWLKRDKIRIQLSGKITDEQVSAIYDILNP